MNTQQIKSKNEIVVIIQTIPIVWTKVSRGGKFAKARNSIAEGFSLPQDIFIQPMPNLLVHHLVYSESNNFTKSRDEQMLKENNWANYRFGCLSADISENKLDVAYDWKQHGGAPVRNIRDASGNYSKQTAFQLTMSQWGRLRYNGRFSNGETWWYEKDVINIGLFKLPVSLDIFVSNEPSAICSQMAQLW